MRFTARPIEPVAHELLVERSLRTSRREAVEATNREESGVPTLVELSNRFPSAKPN